MDGTVDGVGPLFTISCHRLSVDSGHNRPIAVIGGGGDDAETASTVSGHGAVDGHMEVKHIAGASTVIIVIR